MKHLNLFELADPNGEVDAVMSEAVFLPSATSVGDIVQYDGLRCKVLQTYRYYCSEADFSLTLAIVYPPELQAPEKADWWCHSAERVQEQAGAPYYQTRHIFVSERTQNIFDLSSVFSWNENDLELVEVDGAWKIKQCHTFACDKSPIPSLYVALCEKQSQRELVAA